MFPTYTRTRTHLLYLGEPLATFQPEDDGDNLRVTRDVRRSNWSIDACLEAHGRLSAGQASNIALV